jgi:hypothetical protein
LKSKNKKRAKKINQDSSPDQEIEDRYKYSNLKIFIRQEGQEPEENNPHIAEKFTKVQTSMNNNPNKSKESG